MKPTLSLFLFFSEEKRSWHMRLSPTWCTHCVVVTFDGDCWIWHEIDVFNIKFRRIAREDNDIVKWLKAFEKTYKRLSAFIAVSLNVKQKPLPARILPTRWFFTCNELSRELSGVDIGFTFNPAHLYAKLIKYNAKRNYRIIWEKRINHGI